MSQNEVVPRLFLGAKPAPGQHTGIDAIVFAALEYQPSAELFPGTEVLHIPLVDDSSRPLREDEIVAVLRAADHVARWLREGRRVLSTCAMGLNRSAVIAALAMCEVYGMTSNEIVYRIRRARGPFALSNPNFEQLLRVVCDLRRQPRVA